MFHVSDFILCWEKQKNKGPIRNLKVQIHQGKIKEFSVESSTEKI